MNREIVNPENLQNFSEIYKEINTSDHVSSDKLNFNNEGKSIDHEIMNHEVLVNNDKNLNTELQYQEEIQKAEIYGDNLLNIEKKNSKLENENIDVNEIHNKDDLANSIQHIVENDSKHQIESNEIKTDSKEEPNEELTHNVETNDNQEKNKIVQSDENILQNTAKPKEELQLINESNSNIKSKSNQEIVEELDISGKIRHNEELQEVKSLKEEEVQNVHSNSKLQDIKELHQQHDIQHNELQPEVKSIKKDEVHNLETKHEPEDSNESHQQHDVKLNEVQPEVKSQEIPNHETKHELGDNNESHQQDDVKLNEVKSQEIPNHETKHTIDNNKSHQQHDIKENQVQSEVKSQKEVEILNNETKHPVDDNESNQQHDIKLNEVQPEVKSQKEEISNHEIIHPVDNNESNQEHDIKLNEVRPEINSLEIPDYETKHEPEDNNLSHQQHDVLNEVQTDVKSLEIPNHETKHEPFGNNEPYQHHYVKLNEVQPEVKSIEIPNHETKHEPVDNNESPKHHDVKLNEVQPNHETKHPQDNNESHQQHDIKLNEIQHEVKSKKEEEIPIHETKPEPEENIQSHQQHDIQGNIQLNKEEEIIKDKNNLKLNDNKELHINEEIINKEEQVPIQIVKNESIIDDNNELQINQDIVNNKKKIPIELIVMDNSKIQGIKELDQHQVIQHKEEQTKASLSHFIVDVESNLESNPTNNENKESHIQQDIIHNEEKLKKLPTESEIESHDDINKISHNVENPNKKENLISYNTGIQSNPLENNLDNEKQVNKELYKDSDITNNDIHIVTIQSNDNIKKEENNPQLKQDVSTKQEGLNDSSEHKSKNEPNNTLPREDDKPNKENQLEENHFKTNNKYKVLENHKFNIANDQASHLDDKYNDKSENPSTDAFNPSCRTSKEPSITDHPSSLNINRSELNPSDVKIEENISASNKLLNQQIFNNDNIALTNNNELKLDGKYSNNINNHITDNNLTSNLIMQTNNVGLDNLNEYKNKEVSRGFEDNQYSNRYPGLKKSNKEIDLIQKNNILNTLTNKKSTEIEKQNAKVKEYIEHEVDDTSFQEAKILVDQIFRKSIKKLEIQQKLENDGKGYNNTKSNSVVESNRTTGNFVTNNNEVDMVKKKSNNTLYKRDNEDKNLDLPQSINYKKLNKDKENKSISIVKTEESNPMYLHTTEKDIFYLNNSIDNARGNTVILPSNPVSYENFSLKNNKHKDKNSLLGSSERHNDKDVYIYPINKKRKNNFSLGVGYTGTNTTVTEREQDRLNIFKRNTSSNSNKILISEDLDNSLNEKVDKLIVDIKRDTSHKKPQSKRSKFEKFEPSAEILKHRLSSSLDTKDPTKIEDYFTFVVGGVRKDNHILKGISEKIMKLDPKKNIKTENIMKNYLDNTSSPNMIANNNNQKKEYKNIYENIGHRVAECGLNYLCKAKFNYREKAAKISKNQQSDHNSTLFSYDNFDFFASYNKLNTSNNISTVKHQKQPNNKTMIDRTTTNRPRRDEISYKNNDDFFDWDYRNKNVKMLSFNELNQHEYFAANDSPKITYKVTSPPRKQLKPQKLNLESGIIRLLILK